MKNEFLSIKKSNLRLIQDLEQIQNYFPPQIKENAICFLTYGNFL